MESAAVVKPARRGAFGRSVPKADERVVESRTRSERGRASVYAMSDSDAGEVTGLLRAWHAGDEDAYRQLSSILYSELRRQAARCMRGARPGGTLQTTGLVHEAFIRLAGAHSVDWQDRKHFLVVAGRTMRRLLVDL